MKMIYTIAAVFALSGAALADDAPRNCTTNWVGGACGPVKSDASHSGDYVATPQPEKECEEHEESAV